MLTLYYIALNKISLKIILIKLNSIIKLIIFYFYSNLLIIYQHIKLK